MNTCSIIFVLIVTITGGICHDFKSFEDTVLYKIDWPGDVGPNFDPEKFESMMMTTSDNEQYRCLIPHANKKEEGYHSANTYTSPLNFISPIFSATSCSYRIEAYWTYEICHGYHVKQYHEEREGKTTKVQEYFLGKWDETKTEALEQKIKEDFQNGKKFKYTKIDNVKYPYLEMEMSDGTLCDLNNEPRVTRVRYVCYPHGKNEIYTLKETSSCNYEAVILTSVLCMHSAFLPEDSDENVINCLPVEGSPEKPLSWLMNKIDDMKIRYKKISEMFRPKENIAIIKVDPKDRTVRVDIINTDGEDKLPSLESTNPESVTPPSNLQVSSNPKDTTPVIEFIEGVNCLTGGTGWWKYEFCYGKYVRQFHSDRTGSVTLFLGFFDENKHKEWLKQNPDKRPAPKAIRTDISHLYQGGTVCDKTGEKRQTEVKLKCMLNVPSPSTVSMYLLEPKTCQYILVVESPLICDILKLVDEDGLVQKPEEDDGSKTKKTEGAYVEKIIVEEVDVLYQND